VTVVEQEEIIWSIVTGKALTAEQNTIYMHLTDEEAIYLHIQADNDVDRMALVRT
jgi:hypothetical protein